MIRDGCIPAKFRETLGNFPRIVLDNSNVLVHLMFVPSHFV